MFRLSKFSAETLQSSTKNKNRLRARQSAPSLRVAHCYGTSPTSSSIPRFAYFVWSQTLLHSNEYIQKIENRRAKAERWRREGRKEKTPLYLTWLSRFENKRDSVPPFIVVSPPPFWHSITRLLCVCYYIVILCPFRLLLFATYLPRKQIRKVNLVSTLCGGTRER